MIAAVAGAMGVSGVTFTWMLLNTPLRSKVILPLVKNSRLSSLLQSKKSTEARGVTTTSDVARKIVKRAGAALPQRQTPAKRAAAAKATTPASEEMEVAFSSDSAAPVVTVAASSEATSESATSTKAAKSTTEQTAAASSASDVLTSVAASSASEKRTSVSAAPVTPAESRRWSKWHQQRLSQRRPTGTYTVVDGDTLSSIAAANGVTVAALTAANPTGFGNVVHWPGAKLCQQPERQ